MGTIGFAENRTPPGNVMGFYLSSPLGCFFQCHIHPAQLLKKEFAGTRSAFVSSNNVGDLTEPVQNVDHKGLAARGNDSRARYIRQFYKLIRIFHSLRFGYRGKVHIVAEFPSGGDDPVK